MFRHFFEEERARERWRYYLNFIRLYPYETLQNQIIKAYKPYRAFVSKYSKITGRKVFPLDQQYLEKNPKVTNNNITLLKNAFQLWQDALNTSESIQPVLHHYCFHCFISFFNYSFFRWDPEHAKSHGVRISKWSEDILDIELQFLKKGGLFQRFIDTWTLLGGSLAFSQYIPIKKEELKFTENKNYIIDDSNKLTLKELIQFKPRAFEKWVISDFANEWIRCDPLKSSAIMQINNNLKNYLILFVASSIARYRPYLWELILSGKTPEQSRFARASITALFDLSINNLLNNVKDLFWSIETQSFSIT